MTTAIVVPMPKRKPGRKATQALLMAGTATALTNKEKPPKPKPNETDENGPTVLSGVVHSVKRLYLFCPRDQTDSVAGT